MEKQEVHKLFNLLETLHAGQKRPRDIGTITAWADVLALWTYEAVREAAIKRAQKGNRYFPDAAELVEYLPKPEVSDDYEPIDVDKYRNEKWEKITAWRHVQYHAAGIPTAIEAKRQGIPYREWCAMVDAAFPDGVPDPDEEEVCETKT